MLGDGKSSQLPLRLLKRPGPGAVQPSPEAQGARSEEATCTGCGMRFENLNPLELRDTNTGWLLRAWAFCSGCEPRLDYLLPDFRVPIARRLAKGRGGRPVEPNAPDIRDYQTPKNPTNQMSTKAVKW